MFFSSEVRSYESKTMSIIFLKFAREMFANFVQSSGGVQVAVLSSLRNVRYSHCSKRSWTPVSIASASVGL